MQNKILVEVKDLMKSRLEEYKDISITASSLAGLLFEEERSNMSHTCNTYQSKEWIKENFSDISELIPELSYDNDGNYHNTNPFTNPELFQVDIMLKVGDYMLGKCSEVEKYGNDEILLTDKKIDEIKQELDMLDLSNGLQGMENVSLKDKKEDYGMEM